jgi:hypothetical protein
MYLTGIYSSNSQWSPIMGGTSQFSRYPLWYGEFYFIFLFSALTRVRPLLCCRYAHYDYNPSFSDFVPFGGWNSPAIKQYAGDESFCSAGVDKNYY